MPNKFSLNAVFKREKVCPLRIVGFTSDGKYLLHKVLAAIKHVSLTSVFPEDVLVEGANLKMPDGRIMQLVHKRETAYWDTTYPQEEIVMSHQELEVLEADHNAATIFSQVATRRETGTTSRGRLRFLPRNAAGTT